jgi:hypothetical protein
MNPSTKWDRSVALEQEAKSVLRSIRLIGEALGELQERAKALQMEFHACFAEGGPSPLQDRQMAEFICHQIGTTLAEIHRDGKRSRKMDVSRKRWCAIRAMAREQEWNDGRIAALLGFERSTIARARKGPEPYANYNQQKEPND